MQLKANVHMHTSDDPVDAVSYSLFEAVDYAASIGFDVLAITCHHTVAWTQEYATYAAGKGILLISGIELSVGETIDDRGYHVLLLGATKDAEYIKTFAELAAYRTHHTEAVVIAPHPYFYGNFSLHTKLEQYINLFDAIEHSWFYSRHMNRNLRAIEVARRHHLPLIATSDTHFFDFMQDNYSVINATEKSEGAVLNAVKTGSFSIYTRPRRLWSEMILPQSMFFIKTIFARLTGASMKIGES